ncbi:MAG: hypothetical protein JNJ58_01830 [Chitinophagaceae bacterium]|nr:hypothetical protein [Chitinophagaceae bacterium]
MATVSKDSQVFLEKITLGFKMAYEKLVREAALHNRSLVFGKNGKPVRVPAVQLLQDLDAVKTDDRKDR